MNMAKTGRLITQLRLGLGLTQAQLAQRLDVTDKAVSKWERGVSHS
ncbi:helix-turn-helix domain-containing protein [Acutalibacter caecimuris]|nr:helix-turn-helix domain-containing protein [Acutalibacter sp. M00118]